MQRQEFVIAGIVSLMASVAPVNVKAMQNAKQGMTWNVLIHQGVAIQGRGKDGAQLIWKNIGFASGVEHLQP